jgi:hypothetical protein
MDFYKKKDWVSGIVCLMGVVVAGLGLLTGSFEVLVYGLIGMGAIIVPLAFVGIYTSAKRDAEVGKMLRAMGIYPSGNAVAEVMRDYPFQNVVYGTAASEIMELRYAEEARERHERLRRG